MMNSVLLALAALLSTPLTAVGQMNDDMFSNSTECLSISDIICSEGVNLNALCEVITITELIDDLDEDAWTIFAPTDDAFEALGRDNLDSLVMSNDTVALTDLMLFHIVPGVTLTSDLLPCEAGNNLLEMANGEDSRTLCVNKTDPIEQRGQFNDKEDAPKFVDMDIMACNGVVHTLDKVLLYQELPYDIPEVSNTPLETAPETISPSVVGSDSSPDNFFSETVAPTSDITTINATTAATEEEPSCLTVVDLACSNSDFSTVCTLLTEYGLADDLRSGTWTIFAPTNEAFNKAPPLEDEISFILLGHAIEGRVVGAEDLQCTQRTTMANGKDTRTVCEDGITYQKGRGNSGNDKPQITQANIEACNGIVHVVNEVILF